MVLTYRQTEKAEDVAKLAGTERVTEGGADYDTGHVRSPDGYFLGPSSITTVTP